MSVMMKMSSFISKERHMRELMAQEKDKVLRENQQLQDQISVLNDMLQTQGPRQTEATFQPQVTRNPEPRMRTNMNDVNFMQPYQGVSQAPQPPYAQITASAQAPHAGNNTRLYQNQQNLQQQQRQFQHQPPQTRGFAGPQSTQHQYQLVDREAASLMGRRLLGDTPSLSSPFQGTEDVSPGAFAAPHIPFVHSDGAPASQIVPQTISGSPRATPTPSQTPETTSSSISNARNPSNNVTRVDLSPVSGSSPSHDRNALVPKAPNPPATSSICDATAAPIACDGTSSQSPTRMSSSSTRSLTKSLEEEDWQIQFGTCPKCQLKFYDMEMLQMHVIECLDE